MEQMENKPDYNPTGKSFLAWVGGKSQLSKQIIELRCLDIIVTVKRLVVNYKLLKKQLM